MKKKKALLSISLVTLMILLLGMNGLVFAEENTSPVNSENTGHEENEASTPASEQADISDTQSLDVPASENTAPEALANESENAVVPAGEEAVGGTSWETATIINLNQTYTESLGDDDKYYMFTTDKPGYIYVNFSHDYIDDDHTYWSIRVFNKNDPNKELVNWDFIGNQTTQVSTQTLGLDAGSYIVIFGAGWRRATNENYNYEIKYEASENWEKEYNNTPVTATKISVNSAYYGNIQYQYDYDYYEFELSEAGSVTVSFDHRYYGTDWNCWELEMFNWDDVNNSFINQYYIGNSTTTSYTPSFGLPAGKYLLKMCGGWWDGGKITTVYYKFDINFEPSNNWEKEKNDGVLSATTIQTNVDIKGSLQYDGDKDYYSFYIPNSDNVSLSFKHEYVDSNNTFWYVDVCNYKDVNNSLLSERFTGNNPETVTTKSLFLEAGTYIIKVTKGSYSGVTYSLRANSSENIKKVTGVSVSPVSTNVAVGATVQLTETVTPADATNKNVTWKSSNTKVATVDTKGKVTGIKDGTVTITVKTEDGGYTAAAKVTVGKGGSEEPAPGDDPSDPDTELTPLSDGSYQYTLLLGEKYKVKIDGINSKSLETSNGKIVSIADKKKGIVQGKKVGSTDVTCTVNGSEKTIHFKVEYPAINAPSNYVLVGDTLAFTTKGTGISNVRWSVNNARASITDKGVLTGNSAGNTQVTMTIHKKNYKVKIIVENPGFAKSSYNIKAGTVSNIKLGRTKQGAKVSYSLSDESVATFIPDGRIAALSPGTTTLTATLGNKNFTTQITVE